MYSLFDQEWVTRVHNKTLFRQGEARGEARDELKRAQETANRMLARDMPEEDIAELSRLTLAEVRELKAQMAEPVR